MKTMSTIFKMNDNWYMILERSRRIYFAAVYLYQTGSLIGYETGRITVSKGGKKVISGKEVEFQESENVVATCLFGTHDADEFHPKKNKSQCYDKFIENIRVFDPESEIVKIQEEVPVWEIPSGKQSFSTQENEENLPEDAEFEVEDQEL